jgi:RNA polymerase sigma-70 factor (ECF subfamily)
MPTDEEDREQLLRRVLGERLKIIPYLRSIVRRRDMAEDIFQDLCVLALQKRQELAALPHLGSWPRTAARQLAMNALRKRSNQSVQLGDKVHDLMDRHWDALDSTTGSSMGEALEGCVQRLAPGAKDIINARYVEGLGCSELAQRLGRPVESLYVTLSRIHKKLAKCIQRSIALQGGNNV